MAATQVLLVTQDGCNPCLRVRRILGDIARDAPGLAIREVQLDSEEGLRLAQEFAILFPPAVIGDGRLLAKGKIHETDLRQALGLAAPQSV